ncbi:hypothetical protein [Paenibacillus harenae]|uniref:hypothetical protein n=1 Tax=Paenibacillus harenae TaxID=306543 RepID=UPI00048C7AE6|nr:hypothetical protein [Paenibacillus harenae]
MTRSGYIFAQNFTVHHDPFSDIPNDEVPGGEWTPPYCPPVGARLVPPEQQPLQTVFQLAESFEEQVVIDAVSFKLLEEALTLTFDAREFFINGRLDGAGRHNLRCQALIFLPK